MRCVRNAMPHIYPWPNKSIHIINKFQDFSVHSDWGKHLSATQICCSSDRISWMTSYLGQNTTMSRTDTLSYGSWSCKYSDTDTFLFSFFLLLFSSLTQRPQPQKWSFCFITSFEVLAFTVPSVQKTSPSALHAWLVPILGTGRFLCECLGVYTCIGRYVCLGVHALREFRDHSQAFSSMILHFCCSFLFPSLLPGNFWLTYVVWLVSPSNLPVSVVPSHDKVNRNGPHKGCS